MSDSKTDVVEQNPTPVVPSESEAVNENGSEKAAGMY